MLLEHGLGGFSDSDLADGPVTAGAIVGGAGRGVTVEPSGLAVHSFAFAKDNSATAFRAGGGGGGVGACGDRGVVLGGGLHWLVSPDRG